jgi:hypothetical protein
MDKIPSSQRLAPANRHCRLTPSFAVVPARARVTVPAFKHDAIRLRLGVHNASLEIFGASLFASRSQAFWVDCHGKWAVYADKNRPEHVRVKTP